MSSCNPHTTRAHGVLWWRGRGSALGIYLLACTRTQVLDAQDAAVVPVPGVSKAAQQRTGALLQTGRAASSHAGLSGRHDVPPCAECSAPPAAGGAVSGALNALIAVVRAKRHARRRGGLGTRSPDQRPTTSTAAAGMTACSSWLIGRAVRTIVAAVHDVGGCFVRACGCNPATVVPQV